MAYLPQRKIYALLLGRYGEGRELFLRLLFLNCLQLQTVLIPETEQDPTVLAPHVLSLPFVCGKTLAKE